MPSLTECFIPTDDVVARDIDGELIIVPLTADVADGGDSLYTLNEVGIDVWKRLDGRSLREVIASLEADYDATPDEIEKDVRALLSDLLKLGLVVKSM